MRPFDQPLQPQDELQWLTDSIACPSISTLWPGDAMYLECRPKLGPPADFFAEARNIAAALEKSALARLCPQRQHEEIDVGSREAVAQDERTFVAEPAVEEIEQLVGTGRPALLQHREGLVAVDQRATMVGDVDRRIDIAAHEGEPGQINPVIIAAGRRCQPLVGMSDGEEGDDGGRFEDRPPVVEPERRDQPERRDLAEGRL